MTTTLRATWMLLCALLVAGCGGAQTSPPTARDDDHRHHVEDHRRVYHVDDDRHAHRHDDVAAAEIASGSIYNLTGEWWDASGERAPLARLAGRPRVVAMVYTNCAQACPAIIAEMKRVEAAMGPEAHHVGFVLASMDPERDTPERLAEFARRSRFDGDRWTLLGAAEGDVLELAAVLGVQFRRVPDGEFTHSNILTVLDANGEIVHRQLGLGEDPAATARAALRAAHSHEAS